MSCGSTLYVTANDESTEFPNVNTKQAMMDNNETCCVIKSVTIFESCHRTQASESEKEKQDTWSYNSIFGEDAEPLLLETSFTGNSPTEELFLLSQKSSHNVSESKHESPRLDLSFDNQTEMENDSIDFLASSPNSALPPDNKDDLENFQTQLNVDPGSIENIISKEISHKEFIVDETQYISPADEIIEDTCCSQSAVTPERIIEDSFIDETQIEESDQPDSVACFEPSPSKKKKIFDTGQRISDYSVLREIQLARTDSVCSKRKIPSKLNSSTRRFSRNLPHFQEEISRSGQNETDLDNNSSQLSTESDQGLNLTNLSEESTPDGLLAGSRDERERDGFISTGNDENSDGCEYEALFESQSKRKSSVIGSPEKDDDLSFLRGRSPSPVELVINQCVSPVFLVPSEDYVVRKRKISTFNQIRTLTQPTQETRPLSLQFPNTQEFEYGLNEGKSAVTSTQNQKSNFNDLTQMTQEMEPLSLLLPSTQDFQRQLNYQHLESMTQMTQEMEPLSLQLPSTQDFQRQLNYQNLELVTQKTQEMKPLPLQLPSTQDFQRQLNYQNLESVTQKTQEMKPLPLQLPSTQDFPLQLKNQNLESMTQMTQEMEPLSLQLPSTQDFQRQLKNHNLESMTQMTQEMEPLSLQLPSTQDFQRQLNYKNLESVTQKTEEKQPLPLQLPSTQDFPLQLKNQNLESMTQMTQEMEPLSLQLPSTQDFQRQLKNHNLESMTQMTQEMEPLSLQLPSTQDFQRQLNYKNLESVTQKTEEKQPLPLQLPSTQDFQRQLNNQNLQSMTQMTQEMEPLSLQLPPTQDFQRQLKNQHLESMTQMTQEMEPLSLILPETQEFQHQLFKTGGNTVDLTQQTQEIQPVSLQLPTTQHFKCPLSAQIKNENFTETPDIKPLTMKFPSTRQLSSVTKNIREQIKIQENAQVESIASKNSGNCKQLVIKNSFEEVKENVTQQNTAQEIRKNEEEIIAKSSRHRTNGTNKNENPHCQSKPEMPNVAFSNKSSNLKPVVKLLGGAVTEKLEEASVFVCDRYRMTWKMKIALDKKIPVVCSNWLTESKKFQTFQPTVPYILQDNRKNKM